LQPNNIVTIDKSIAKVIDFEKNLCFIFLDFYSYSLLNKRLSLFYYCIRFSIFAYVFAFVKISTCLAEDADQNLKFDDNNSLRIIM